MFYVTVVEKEEEGAKGSENENGGQVSEKKETTEGIASTDFNSCKECSGVLYT